MEPESFWYRPRHREKVGRSAAEPANDIEAEPDPETEPEPAIDPPARPGPDGEPEPPIREPQQPGTPPRR